MLVRQFSRVCQRTFKTSAFQCAEEKVSSQGIPSKLTLNFATPSESLYQNEQVDLVSIPGSIGEFGVTAGHVPIVAQLKPGVVAVHRVRDKEIEKYFVAGGFSITHANSVTDITVVEALRIEDIDPSAAREGAQKYKADLAAATPDTPEYANAKIGVEMHDALIAALGTSA